MKTIFTIILIIFSVNLLSQKMSPEKNETEVISKLIDFNYKLDSLQKIMDSVSHHSDSIYQSILNDIYPDSLSKMNNSYDFKKDYYEEIQGPWTDLTTENATFSFVLDSIFYVDALKSYKYTITNDSIIIFFENYSSKFKILRISPDSLILKSEYGIDKYQKFKD